MAYEKQTWVCGETITADKLNHIEEGIEDCCGGGSDCGYECEETKTLLTEQSVTTTQPQGYPSATATLQYSVLIDAEKIIITFDGVEYELDRMGDNGYYYYGNFEEYPFQLSSNNYGNEISTPSSGTHSIKIERTTSVATTTPCFEMAVKSVMAQEKSPIQTFLIRQTGQEEWTPSISAGEMNDLVISGVTLIGAYNNERYYLMSRRDTGYGLYEFTYVNTSIDASDVKLKIFQFTTAGQSSYEEKTLTVS